MCEHPDNHKAPVADLVGINSSEEDWSSDDEDEEGFGDFIPECVAGFVQEHFQVILKFGVCRSFKHAFSGKEKCIELQRFRC